MHRRAGTIFLPGVNSMHIFDFRNQLIDDYASYINSFIQIRDPQINQYVQQKLQEGVLWPEPLIQLNPFFAPGESIDELVAQGVLHPGCARIFRKDKSVPTSFPSSITCCAMAA